MKILSYFFLSRPVMSSIAGSVAVSIYLATSVSISLLVGISVFLVVTLTSIYGFVLNDYHDRIKDAISHPNRMLPQGKITPEMAFRFAVVVAIISLMVSIHLSVGALIIHTAAILILAIYSYVNNRYGIWANAITACICAFVPLFGMANGSFIESLIPVLVGIFFLIFGREMILDIRDLVADKKIGKTSFPINHGPQLTLIVAGFFFFICTISSIIAALVWTGLLFMIFAAIIPNILIWTAFLGYVIEQKPSRLNAFRLATQLAFVSFIGAMLF